MSEAARCQLFCLQSYISAARQNEYRRNVSYDPNRPCVWCQQSPLFDSLRFTLSPLNSWEISTHPFFSSGILNPSLRVVNIEGFRPEWCIPTTYHLWDTPFWSGTLEFCSCFKFIIFWDFTTTFLHHQTFSVENKPARLCSWLIVGALPKNW